MLKKLIFICLLHFFAVGHLFAQSFTADLSLGLAANQIDGDNLGGYNKAGLVAGAGVGFPLSEKLFLRPEGFFKQKGSRSTENDAFFLIWRINYVQIPVVLKYTFHPRFFGIGGLAADVVVSSKQQTGGGGFRDVTGSLRRVTPISVLGFGYNLSPTLSFNARYEYSLISFLKSTRSFTNTIAIYVSVNLNKEK